MVLDYSLFGMRHQGYNNVINGTDHPYGFIGKEEQNELDLDWHDFGARNYDAAIGRWMNLDPMSEMFYAWTPYKYSMNNPILLSDHDGNCEFCKKLLKSAWTTYKSTISSTYEGAKKLVTSPVQTVKKAATDHFNKLTTPEGVINLVNQATSVATGGMSDKANNIAQTILSDEPAKTAGDKIGETAANLTIEAIGVLGGEILGKGATLLKGVSKMDDGIVLIGEGMERVKDAKGALIENGAKGVEIFTPSRAAAKEWAELTKGGVELSDDVVKNSLLYSENQTWINSVKKSGKTVLDIGSDGRANPSPIYEMEKSTVYD